MTRLSPNMPQLDLSEEILPNKFFRFLQDPSTNWKPYRNTLMYDDHPEFGTFESTFFLSNPKYGDYLVLEPDGNLYVVDPVIPERFDGVEFHAMPSLQNLQESGTVVETPESIRKLDYMLQDKLFELSFDILEAENLLSDLEGSATQRKFGFPTKAARESKKQMEDQKAAIAALYEEFSDLETQLKEQVFDPLKSISSRKIQRTPIDEMVSKADERAKQQLKLVQTQKDHER